MKKAFTLLFLLFSFQTQAVEADNRQSTLRLATTTSVDNSGLLKHLLPRFAENNPYQIQLTVVGSGKALRMGRSGEVDVVWVHSPRSEKKFVDEGYGINHHQVMRNDFVLVGPESDPAGISSASDVADALKKIANSQLVFVSRADDSGTNKKELLVWQLADIDPVGNDWYLETGTGMAATLKMAEAENAYLLIDRATFSVRQEKGLKILLEDSENLSNPYSVIAVNPAKNSNINHLAATRLISWLISTEGQQAIAGFKHDGQQLYYPVR